MEKNAKLTIKAEAGSKNSPSRIRSAKATLRAKADKGKDLTRRQLFILMQEK